MEMWKCVWILFVGTFEATGLTIPTQGSGITITAFTWMNMKLHRKSISDSIRVEPGARANRLVRQVYIVTLDTVIILTCIFKTNRSKIANGRILILRSLYLSINTVYYEYLGFELRVWHKANLKTTAQWERISIVAMAVFIGPRLRPAHVKAQPHTICSHATCFSILLLLPLKAIRISTYFEIQSYSFLILHYLPRAFSQLQLHFTE